MKKCIVISDSFKGSLSSLEICSIAQEHIPLFFPDCQVVALPVADGGEGTVDCFLRAMDGRAVTAQVSGPYGEPLSAVYARVGETAMIEMAAAAGLPLVDQRLHPDLTTTFGVGELIRHAVASGAKQIVLGLGGSATNDGGCGAAAALGAVFLDPAGQPFVPTGGTLSQISHIDISAVGTFLAGVSITAMCDIENPMFGPNGAACIFGPQKGADPLLVAQLDAGLAHLSAAMETSLGQRVAALPGAGAAGGFGAGCVAFLGATLKPGIDTILDLVGFDALLEGCDLVLTGEGRIDGQSLQGKVISGVARRTKRAGVPLVALVGDVLDDAYAAYELGVTAIFSINRLAIPFSQAKSRSRLDYIRTLEDLLRFTRALTPKR